MNHSSEDRQLTLFYVAAALFAFATLRAFAAGAVLVASARMCLTLGVFFIIMLYPYRGTGRVAALWFLLPPALFGLGLSLLFFTG